MSTESRNCAIDTERRIVIMSRITGIWRCCQELPTKVIWDATGENVDLVAFSHVGDENVDIVRDSCEAHVPVLMGIGLRRDGAVGYVGLS